ncbi:DUF1772 domain-containing protein [Neptunicoccus cionae]|uniref:anthrone oxygenase family protein n=1 Tax=Neptunicoccus cionae TaxID=2035344 RepID=UPI0015E080F9|nr:anthrone oxygenase family protein [Amylibacter cionae]
MIKLLQTGILWVVLLFGILGGFFFSFSFVTMPGLDLISGVAAIEAMQGINTAVRNAYFFVPFFLTPVFAFAFAGVAVFTGCRRAAYYLGASAVLYLAGGFAVTVFYHIPMNEALAVVDGPVLGVGASEVWRTYSQDWTPLNTFRMSVCLLAMVLAVLALYETKA